MERQLPSSTYLKCVHFGIVLGTFVQLIFAQNKRKVIFKNGNVKDNEIWGKENQF